MSNPNLPKELTNETFLQDTTASTKDRIIERSRKQWFLPVGIAGLLGTCAWGVYSYKYRAPHMTTSRYLMKLRVLAQSCVVGAIMVGAIITGSQYNEEDQNKR